MGVENHLSYIQISQDFSQLRKATPHCDYRGELVQNHLTMTFFNEIYKFLMQDICDETYDTLFSKSHKVIFKIKNFCNS